MNSETLTVYITKYALTSGITKVEFINYRIDSATGGLFGYVKGDSFKCLHGYTKKEYSLTEGDAQIHFDLMKSKKLSSLEKQKEKLLKMEFKVK